MKQIATLYWPNIFLHPVFNHRFNLKEACKLKVKMNSLIFEHESQVDHWLNKAVVS